MASVRIKLRLEADPARVWAAIRDFGAAVRLFTGVVVHSHLDGRERVVRFADGSEVREVLVARDEQELRLVYAAVGSSVASHHSASFEVQASDEGGTLVVWTTDILPDALAEPVGVRMRAGMEALERNLSEAH